MSSPRSLRHRLLPVAFVLVAVLGLAASPAAARGGNDSRYGATTLELDAAAVSALTGLGVTPAPIAPARAVSAGVLAFPITNSFKSALRSGVIRHSGGISLTAGSTTVRLTDFVIDPLRRQLTARVGDARVPILALDFANAGLSVRRGTLRLGPVGGSLTDVAASALNAAFGLPAGTVPAGLKLGDATVRYRLHGWVARAAAPAPTRRRGRHRVSQPASDLCQGVRWHENRRRRWARASSRRYDGTASAWPTGCSAASRRPKTWPRRRCCA